MRYFVIGHRRYKTAEEFRNKVVGHNHRKRHYAKNPHDNIDRSRSAKNIELTPLQFESYDELLEWSKERLAKGKRNLKRGAAWGFEMIVDCTPSERWREEDYIAYLREAEAWLRKRFDGLKVISSVIHLDEGKPHLHVTFSYFNEREGAWWQRKLKEQGLDRLPKLLDDFEREVGSKYGLHRGGNGIDKPLVKELSKAVETVEVRKGIFGKERRKVLNMGEARRAIRRLSSKHKRALAENDKLREELVRLRQENEKLKDDLTKFARRNVELETKHNKEKRELERSVLELQRELQSVRQELQETKRELQRKERGPSRGVDAHSRSL